MKTTKNSALPLAGHSTAWEEREMFDADEKKSVNRQIARRLGWWVELSDDGQHARLWDNATLYLHQFDGWHGEDALQQAWSNVPKFCDDLNWVVVSVRSLFVEFDKETLLWGADVNFDTLQPSVQAEAETPQEAAARALLKALIGEEELANDIDDGIAF